MGIGKMDEEMINAMKAMAKIHSTYFLELIKSGIELQIAFKLTTEFMKVMMAQGSQQNVLFKGKA